MQLKTFFKTAVSLSAAALFASLMLSCAKSATVKRSASTNDAQTPLVSFTNGSSLGERTPDVSWFTKNPNADTFYISTADQLAGLAAIVNGTVWMAECCRGGLFVRGWFNFHGRHGSNWGGYFLERDIYSSAFNITGEPPISYMIVDNKFVEITDTTEITDESEIFVDYRYNHVRFNFRGRTIVLTDDIDLSEYGRDSTFNNGNGWIAIGGGSNRIWGRNSSLFAGTFDGNGKTINELFSKGDSWGGRINGGLFGVVSGTIKNLRIVDAEIDGRHGGIVGHLRGGEISNSSFEGTITGNFSGWGRVGVGGIVGAVDSGIVSNSYFNGTINSDRAAKVGGIAGSLSNGSIISNSYSVGNISGRFGVGGIVGIMTADSNGGNSVLNSYSLATVDGYGSVGGIVGYVLNLAMSEELAELREDFPEPDIAIQDRVDARFLSRMETITLFDTLQNSITNSVALNASVKSSGASTEETVSFVEVEEGEPTEHSYSLDVNVPLIGTDIQWRRPDGDYCWDGCDGDPECGPAFVSAFMAESEARALYTSFARGGRVVGGNDAGILSNNAAFIGITDIHGGTDWSDRNATSINGADVTIDEIMSDGTLGGRFISENGWTVENGKLPGLFGQAVDLPEHLR